MLPFYTTYEQSLEIPQFIQLLYEADLDLHFVAEVGRIAAFDQGMFDLLKMWSESKDPDILQELQKGINDYGKEK